MSIEHPELDRVNGQCFSVLGQLSFRVFDIAGVSRGPKEGGTVWSNILLNAYRARYVLYFLLFRCFERPTTHAVYPLLIKIEADSWKLRER
jgi:hypothetical protein